MTKLARRRCGVMTNRLRLTSGRGRSARSDSVTLSAVPANPLVSVDTMVHNTSGDPGIRVGDTTYLAPPAGGKLGSTALLQKLDPVGQYNNEWEVLVLAVPPAVSDQHGTPPPETLLHRMYDPVSGSNDPEAGGLGISPTQLMGTAPLYGWEHGGPGHDSCRWVL